MIDPATLAEKLRPPRPLERVGNALMAPPLGASTTAWLAWWDGTSASLDTCIAWAATCGATRLTFGGPPGNYVLSGCDASDNARLEVLDAHGFAPTARHFDLVVRNPEASLDARVARCDEELATRTIAWARTHFAEAWGFEAERAATHRGLFASFDESGAPLGFAAHSGNLAHLGTFGPIGVAPAARGSGLGRALALAVLDDLRRRGFTRCTVPWVDADTVAFYRSFVQIEAQTERVMLQRTIVSTGSRGARSEMLR